MGLFDTMLKSGESLFKDENALDFEYVPKMLPYREGQQQQIASAIKPLFDDRSGRNVIIHGAPGLGKTAAVKWILRDMEDTTDEIKPIYMNCWQKNTSHKVICEICHELGYMFTQNKKTDELMNIIEGLCATKSIVFAFDEIDKVEDVDFLYFLLSLPRKTILLITNFKEWAGEVDNRVLSRLTPNTVEFKEYTKEEIRGILKERINYAFVPGVWDEAAFSAIVEKSAETRDVRSGLYLLREAGLSAEVASSKKIMLNHAETGISHLADFKIKNPEDLDEESKQILDLVKTKPGSPIGEVFKTYQAIGGMSSYKTFQRKIDKLGANNFVLLEKKFGGSDGNTTLLHYNTSEKKGME